MGKSEEFIRIAIILLFIGMLIWNTYKHGDVFPGSKVWIEENIIPLAGLTIAVGVFMWKSK